MSYWLMKSEPSVFTIEDLEKSPKQTVKWIPTKGIRNYQARNFIRDRIKINDKIFFYHSNIAIPHIVGLAEVISEPYPDHFALDKTHKYYDPKSAPDNTRWFMLDIKPIKKLDNIVTLESIKNNPKLKDMVLVNRSRLSIQPVTKSEWELIIDMSLS